MTNEEMQSTMEFILEQQAQFASRIGKDEARLARLEDAFVTLVELARIADERQDKTDESAVAFNERLDTMMSLTDSKLAELADAQAHTDRRLNALIDVVERYISKGNNGAPHV